jgi:large subunit ribosomal protein L21
MFAIVRTGGKQYRVAPGDKIAVEKLDGEAGQRISITDVLLAGNGSELQSVEGLTVAAEIIAQAKAEKVVVFKKRRRHNYRRKKGHRQQHTILRIVAIGDHKEETKPKASKATPASASNAEPVDETQTENPAPTDQAAANPAEPSSDQSSAAAIAETTSTSDAAPAKGAAKKTPKAK